MPGETSVTTAVSGRSADTPPATTVTRVEPTLCSDGTTKSNRVSVTLSMGTGLPSSSTRPPARFAPKMDAMPPGERPGSPEAALTGPPKLNGGQDEGLTNTDSLDAPSSRADNVSPAVQLKLTRPSEFDVAVTPEACTRTPG